MSEEEELLLPGPAPSPSLDEDEDEDEAMLDSLRASLSTTAHTATVEDSTERLTSAAEPSNGLPQRQQGKHVHVSETSLLATAALPHRLPSPITASEPIARSHAATNGDSTAVHDASNDALPAHRALPIEPRVQEQPLQPTSDSSTGTLDAVVVPTAATSAAPLASAVEQEQQQQQWMASKSTATSESTPLATAATAAAAAATASATATTGATVRFVSTGLAGRVYPQSPSSEEWHSILLSKQHSNSHSDAVQSLPSPPSSGQKRRRARAAKDATKHSTEPAAAAAAVADDDDDEEMSVAARLRGRRAKREAQEEKAKDEKAGRENEMSVEEDELVAQPQSLSSSSRLELRALLDAGEELSAPSLSSSSLLLSSLDSFSSSFHATLTQLTSSLNSQIEQHTRHLHTDWQTQLDHAHSTQQAVIDQAVEAESARWHSMAQQWAEECRGVRSELDGLRDVQSQLQSLMSSHPALQADEKADGEDKMELFIQYYREKERGMRDKERKLSTREKDVKEREEKVEVRVLFVQQEKKREVDEVREKVGRMRNEWELERAKGVRERKELKEKVEEMKLDRLMRESEVGKLKARVKELTDTIAVIETRTKAAGSGSGGSGGGMVKEEKRRVEVDVGERERERERERREKQDKYVADVEEYLRRQSAELKETRATEAAVKEELRRKDEEAGMERRRAELEERKRVEAEARWSEADKQRVELSRQVAALQAERDSLAEQLRASHTRQPPPLPLLSSPPQQHAAPLTHLVHPSRAAAVTGYTTAPPAAPPAPLPAAAAAGGGRLDADNVSLVRDIFFKLEQEKKARERQQAALLEQREREERDRDRLERDRIARLEAEQRAARERMEAVEREKREREQREQIEREELQRLAEMRSGMSQGGGGMASGGWKSVKVAALADRAQPPLLPTPAAVGGMVGTGHTGRFCSFFNSPRGCRKGDHCDHLHVAASGGGAAGMAAALGKRDEKEEGELDELPMLVR